MKHGRAYAGIEDVHEKFEVVKGWNPHQKKESPLICPCCKGEMKILGRMIRRKEVDYQANADHVACHELVRNFDYRRQIPKECAEGPLNFFFVFMVYGNRSEAEIDCPQAARRVER